MKLPITFRFLIDLIFRILILTFFCNLKLYFVLFLHKIASNCKEKSNCSFKSIQIDLYQKLYNKTTHNLWVPDRSDFSDFDFEPFLYV